MARKRTEPVFWDDGGENRGRPTVRVFTGDDNHTTGTPYTEEDLDDPSSPVHGQAVQGTLFHPDTGTGKKTDPLYDALARRRLARGRYDIPHDEDGSMVARHVAESSIPSQDLAGQGGLLGPEPTAIGRPDRRLTVQVNPDGVSFGANGSYLPASHAASLLPASPQDVTLHEIGHGEHMRGEHDPMYKHKGADPVLEGVADGFRDRFGAEYDDSAVDNSVVGSGPASRVGSPTVRHHALVRPGQPYGALFDGSGNKPGWENDTERALYAASRQHVATTGTPLSSSFIAEDDDEGRTAVPGTADDYGGNLRRSALGRLATQSPEVLNMFQMVGPEHSAEWLNMRNAASDAMTDYRNDRERGDLAAGRRPAGPEAGWMASDEGMRRHNEAVQSSTLPLVDPETGQQYDNTVERPEHPLPRIGHDKKTDKETMGDINDQISQLMLLTGQLSKQETSEPERGPVPSGARPRRARRA